VRGAGVVLEDGGRNNSAAPIQPAKGPAGILYADALLCTLQSLAIGLSGQ